MTPTPSLRPLVVISEDLDPAAEAWLRERCEVDRCALDEPRFAEAISRASALVVRTYTRVDSALLDQAPHLRAVGRAGVGVDNIDVAECRRRGVEVVHTPEANTRAVVELVAGFLLDAIRPRERITEALAERDWRSQRAALTAGRQLSDLTLGILGLGRVGSQVARLGAALDMQVIYCDLIEIEPDRRFGAAPVSEPELFARCNVLSVHVDHRPSNRHLVNEAKLATMRQGAVLINTSRGFVVNAVALGQWLRHDSSALACIDVHDPEPFDAQYPLLGLANAVLTPHIGAATRTAHRNMSRVVEDVWRVLEGEPPRWPAPDP